MANCKNLAIFIVRQRKEKEGERLESTKHSTYGTMLCRSFFALMLDVDSLWGGETEVVVIISLFVSGCFDGCWPSKFSDFHRKTA